MVKSGIAIAITAGLLVGVAGADAQEGPRPTLERVKATGHVQCGVSGDMPGLSAIDTDGRWAGLEVDFCRALSAAIFNEPDNVRYAPLARAERDAALASREIDVFSMAAWTMGADTTSGARFVGTMFYDGLGFMVRRDSGIESALDLGEVPLCIEAGTTAGTNALDYFAANTIELDAVLIGDAAGRLKAYGDGECRALAGGFAQLASYRSTFVSPEDHIILRDIAAKEPLGPTVRHGDENWFSIARWTYFAMLNAEELGVTQANVDEMLGSDSPEIKRLLGVEGDFGTPLGLNKDWAYQIVKHVGNYGDVFERRVGPGTAIGLERGLNALWNDGGIQYAPPIQ